MPRAHAQVRCYRPYATGLPLFLDDGERPTSGRHLADDIISVLAPIEEYKSLRDRVRHCFDYEYTLHDPRVPFIYITPKRGRILLARPIGRLATGNYDSRHAFEGYV